MVTSNSEMMKLWKRNTVLRIHELMAENGISESDLAVSSTIKPERLAQILHDLKTPTYIELAMIAYVFGLGVDDVTDLGVVIEYMDWRTS